MSGPKHTPWLPGPWRYGVPAKGGRGVVVDANGNVVCVVEGGPLRREVTVANAQLIAAAPDLLACLEQMVERHEALGRPDDGWDGRYIDEAKAAIAKAKGETA